MQGPGWIEPVTTALRYALTHSVELDAGLRQIKAKASKAAMNKRKCWRIDLFKFQSMYWRDCVKGHVYR